MEHKVFIGFDSIEDARMAFIQMYSVQALGAIQEVPIELYRQQTAARLTDSEDTAFREEQHPAQPSKRG